MRISWFRSSYLFIATYVRLPKAIRKGHINLLYEECDFQGWNRWVNHPLSSGVLPLRSTPPGSWTIQFHNPIWRTIAGSRKLSIYDTLRTKSPQNPLTARVFSPACPPHFLPTRARCILCDKWRCNFRKKNNVAKSSRFLKLSVLAIMVKKWNHGWPVYAFLIYLLSNTIMH